MQTHAAVNRFRTICAFESVTPCAGRVFHEVCEGHAREIFQIALK